MDLTRIRLRGVLLRFCTALLPVFFCCAFAQEPPAAMNGRHWVGTWAAAMTPAKTAQQFKDQTIREIVHTSIGGSSVRIRLSNTFGTQPLTITAAHIALSSSGTGAGIHSDQTLTFSGQQSVTIPAAATVLSDPASLSVPAAGDLAISLFFAGAASATTVHPSATQTSYFAPGNAVGAPTLEKPAVIHDWPFLSGVDVIPSGPADAVVAFGDSITDGYRSTDDANHRWPDFLAGRLSAQHKTVGVLNEGIGGNRVLHDGEGIGRPEFGRNALSRFDRDVLAPPGAKYLVVLEGINDIGIPTTNRDQAEEVSANEIIAGLRQLIERGHEHGLRVYGGTLTPIGGSTYFTTADEAKRQAVNTWVRTGGAFDGVIDFDAAVRDPNQPTRMIPGDDSGDHLHPNDAGYKAMADAADLALFTVKSRD